MIITLPHQAAWQGNKWAALGGIFCLSNHIISVLWQKRGEKQQQDRQAEEGIGAHPTAPASSPRTPAGLWMMEERYTLQQLIPKV